MHAASVVSIDRFGHERCGLPSTPSGVSHDVLEPHELVCHSRKRVESHVDFALPGRGDFMMANFDLISERRQYLDDLRPKIHQSVRGHDGKVAALVSDLVSQVWVFLLARVPSSL